MLVSYAIKMLTRILNTCSSNFCPARQSWENDRMNHLNLSFLFLFTCTKHAFYRHLLIRFVFIAAIIFVIVNKPKLHPNKEMDGSVKLDWDWKVSAWKETKQNLNVLVDLYYSILLLMVFLWLVGRRWSCNTCYSWTDEAVEWWRSGL